MTIIYKFEAPKQRMTNRYGYIVERNEYKPVDRAYSVHTVNLETGGMTSGHYDLSHNEAAKLFTDMITKHVSNYGPETWERASDVQEWSYDLPAYELRGRDDELTRRYADAIEIVWIKSDQAVVKGIGQGLGVRVGDYLRYNMEILHDRHGNTICELTDKIRYPE